jgi:branched-chain amino acid transport system permease protein
MDYIIHLLILISLFGILGVSLNLIVGYTGLLSVTHAAFFGIGAYVTAILLTQTGINFFLAMIAGIIITMISALAIGVVLSKFNHDYYALASFGFNIIVLAIFMNWQKVTRGPLGIPGIDRPSLFGFEFTDNLWFLVLALVITALIYFAAEALGKTSFGRTLKAIREDEKAIQFFGYNTLVYKLVVFVIGAGMAAVAGSLFASYISFIDPSSFVLMESIFMLAIIIVGGLANNKGALLGAVIIILLPELLRFVGFTPEIAAQMRQVVFGLLLVLLMMYRPQGFLGEYKL